MCYLRQVNPQHGAFDLVIVGAGAAGLAGAIFAAEAAKGRDLRILIIEGARKPGAKILVSGGGRCNVTNERVTQYDFWGGSRAIIRNVLAQFDDRRARQWFEEMGVELKLEPSGKYFPVTNQARTVLEALLARVESLGIRIWTGTRVVGIARSAEEYSVALSDGQTLAARRVIVATGGLALPKSGSDGAGLSMMRTLGHTIVPTTPALTPLVLQKSRSLGGRFAEFTGVALDARLMLFRKGHEKPDVVLEGPLLFTHLGLSGPVAMNMSRHWLRRRLEECNDHATLCLGLPQFRSIADADAWLFEQTRVSPARRLSGVLAALYPERVAIAVAGDGGEDMIMSQLTLPRRQHVARCLAMLPLDVIGARDYTYAEATAGGVDLREIEYNTMESRKAPGLFLCGEILDVDGRIGGFNFQWAWSSGYVAGRGAARSLTL
jgi:predicted Rossmann fold flavoprotein